MIKPSDLARVKTGLAADEKRVRELLASRYDHATQTRHTKVATALPPTSTLFDQDRS